MQKIRTLLYILISVLIVNSCKKNDADTTLQEPLPNDAETVIASVTGIVVNENNIPVQGAAVNLGTQNTTTDIYGMFRFQKIAISKNNGYIKVAKTGYFNGNRSFLTTAGRTHNVRIKLLPKTNTGTINAVTGGSVTLSTGGKVTFTGNTITDAGGNTYSGTVNVAMAWINPTATDLASIIQGDLRGITASGNERVLETYGMLGVELTDGLGQKLKIASGKTAQISLPIPATLQATAPASIPLWYFDEIKGRWIEEGSATKTGSNYVGNVSHFSFWNCDLPGPIVTLCLHLVNQNNQPLNNVTVKLRRVNNPASISYGFTDSLGNVCGAVPANETLTLEILTPFCGTAASTQNIGPFSTNVSITVVATIPASNTLTITGTVLNCNNTPLTNGFVTVYLGGGYYFTIPVDNGIVNASILYCSANPINYTAFAIDNTIQQQGLGVTGTAINGTINLGQLVACGNNSAQYVNTLIDGVPYCSWIFPTDLISSINTGIQQGYTYANHIWAVRYNISGLVDRSTQFTIAYNAIIGTALINGANIMFPDSTYAVTNASFNFNVTELGLPGSGFIAGNFNVQMLFPGNIYKTVICNFRVLRPQ